MRVVPEPAAAALAAAQIVAISLVGVTFAEDPFTVARITTMWAVFLIVAALAALIGAAWWLAGAPATVVRRFSVSSWLEDVIARYGLTAPPGRS